MPSWHPDLDRRPGLATRGRVKPGGGLVEEDQLRVSHERQRQVQPAPLAARQVLGADVALLGQLDERDHLVDRPAALVVAPRHLDELANGEVLLHPTLLEHDPDRLAQPALARCGVAAEHPHVAAGAKAVALEDLHGCGLARAVGSQQAEDLAASDLEADAADGLHLAVGLAQTAYRDGRSLCL